MNTNVKTDLLNQNGDYGTPVVKRIPFCNGVVDKMVWRKEK